VPRLPNVLDLGAAPAAGGERPIGSYDVGPYARGAQALAQGAESLGRGISQAGQDVAHVLQKQQETQAVNAHAATATRLTNLHTSLQNDKDYSTLESRYAEGAAAIVKEEADKLPAGRYRDHFVATSDGLVAHGAAAVNRQAFNGFVQTDNDSRTALLLNIRKNIADNPENPFNGANVDAYNLRIDNAVRNGWITKEQGDLEKMNGAVGVATTHAQVDATRTPLKFLRETGALPRGAEALPSYWNKEAAQRIAGVNQDLMAVVKRASEISGLQFTVGDKGGMRDQATQDQLVAGGFSQTRNSNHLTGNAIDLLPIVNGKAVAEATPEQSAEISRAMKQAAKELGVDVNWGGDWKSFKDVAHFEVAGAARPSNPLYHMIDPATMLRMQNHAQTILRQQANDEARIVNQNTADRVNYYERNIQDVLDGRAGAVLLPREAIENDPLLQNAHGVQLMRQRRAVEKQLGQEATVGANDLSADRENEYLRNIIDVRAGRGQLIPREQIENDPALKPQHRNRVLEMRDAEERRLGGEAETAEVGRLERALIDAAAGRRVAPGREEIEQNPVIGDTHRNRLLAQWDHAQHQDDAFNATLIKFTDPNGGVFNPYDTEERKQVDKIYRMFGADMPALQRVVDRTGIIPAAAAAQLRGALVSNNTQNALAAAQMARNLMAKNPMIFAGVSGEKELQDAGVAYGQYTEHFGMTPEQAAQKIVEHQTPEYKAKVHAVIKDEDVGKIIRDNLKVADLEKAFNESWRGLGGRFSWGGPTVEATEQAKQAAFSDYAELFKSKYLESGDETIAKAQAIEQMKKVWGVSHFGGSGGGTLMRFPPERAPAYANIPNAATRIADDAIDAIYHAPGGAWLNAAGEREITRDKIILMPTHGGETAAAYMAGQPPPYLLGWRDKTGVLHMLSPGKAYVFDPHAAAENVTEERRAGLETAVAKETQKATDIEPRLAADREAMASSSEAMAQLGTPEYFQEAERRRREREFPAQLRGLDRQERALERSGLGGAFRDAQRLRIAKRRSELTRQQEAASAAIPTLGTP
jgi:peptidoglycan LD-endopeptidase CwlK